MKNLEAVTDLTNEKLESMFNLCKAFNIEIMSEGISINDLNFDEYMDKATEPKYYETQIRESFHKYVEMYVSIITIEK